MCRLCTGGNSGVEAGSVHMPDVEADPVTVPVEFTQFGVTRRVMRSGTACAR
jgi:hypothetical protein